MNNLKIFNNPSFGEVRVIERNGEPWFVGKDVALILGYTNSRKAIHDHVDEEDKTDGVTIRDSIGREQKPICVNESGLYSLILGSKLSSARQFKKWITAEVLPSIRKTGGYIAGQEQMSDVELMARAIQVANNLLAEREKEIERMKPKELFADAVTASKTTILVRDVAKLARQNGVNIGEKRLFAWLKEKGLLVKKGRENTPTQRGMDLGLFEIHESAITHSDGHVTTRRTTKVTGKGQIYIINKLIKEFREDSYYEQILTH